MYSIKEAGQSADRGESVVVVEGAGQMSENRVTREATKMLL